MPPIELADTSVWVRKHLPGVREWFVPAVEAGEIATCDMVALELLHSARNPDEYRLIETGLRAMPWLRIEATDWERALDVYRALADRGGAHQRSVPHPDLLIAAVAERTGTRLVHYDADYGTIAAITGQPTRWAAPRGSL